MGAKVDFLGWTHHNFIPKTVNWMIRTAPRTYTNRYDYVGLFTYPTKESINRFRRNIQNITSYSNTFKKDQRIIQELRSIILGWSNYYSPASRLGRLITNLDWYINRCFKRWVYKKYQRGFFKNYSRLFMDSKVKFKLSPGLTSKTDKNNIFTIPRLWKLNSPGAWTVMHPIKELLRFSFITNPVPYIKRALQISTLRGDVKGKLLVKQKKILVQVVIKHL